MSPTPGTDSVGFGCFVLALYFLVGKTHAAYGLDGISEIIKVQSHVHGGEQISLK